MGWGEWPLLEAQQQGDDAPNLIPLQVNANDDQIGPAIEEVVQAVDPNAETPELVEEPPILAMDDLTESSEDEFIPPMPVNPEVVVPDFPNLQNIEAFQVEEVQIEDLVHFDDLYNQNVGANLVAGQEFEQLDNINVGFVQTFSPPVDLGLQHFSLNHGFDPTTLFKGPSPMGVRCWAKFFNNVDRSLPTVTIPTEWVDFFTMLMLKQSSYDWAKGFLTSPA